MFLTLHRIGLLRHRYHYIAPTFLGLCLLWYLFGKIPATQPLNPQYGRLKPTSSSSRYAIATFLSGTAPLDDDYYYTSARILTHQLLHLPPTKSNTSIPFLVLVTSDISQAKRETLRKDGATVVPVEDMKLPGWVRTGVTRWKDQFTKLRLFELTQYDRILFMDADTTLTAPIDGIFNELIVQTPATTLPSRTTESKADEAALPANYVFCTRSNNEYTGKREHPFPPPPTKEFSAGFWVVAPSKEMMKYLMSVIERRGRFKSHTMEQALLNYVFRREGAMPWFELGVEWSATWPNMADWRGGVRSLHEKLAWEGPEMMREYWEKQKKRMEEWKVDIDGN